MCGTSGALVSHETVQYLRSEPYKEDLRLEIFSLCMHPDCEMAYYSADYGYLTLQREMTTPIDFKADASEKYACYCNKITIDDIRHAVLKEHASHIKDIFRFRGPIIVEKCKLNSPFGCSCIADINKMMEEIKQGKSGEL